MSYYDTLACNRELPTGHFGLPPKAVYESYIGYRNSGDFVVPRNSLTGELVDMNSDGMKKLERLKGKVVVYETAWDARWLILEPYAPVITHRGDEVFEPSREVMARHFTLPHLYNLHVGWEETLTEYLCKYLEPGDQVEVYSCLAGEETLKRTREERVVDLEGVILGRDELRQMRLPPEIPFTRYLAPSAPQPLNQIGPVEPIDHVARVIKEREHIAVVLHKSQEQGL